MPRVRRIHFRAFSLLEVVVAIGIFAVGMVAVIALFAPVARSVAEVTEAESAAGVAEQLRGELSRRVLAAGSFAPVVALLKNSTVTGHEVTTSDNTSGAASDPRTDSRLLFASRDGSKIAGYADPVWIDPTSRQPSDAEKFFEITLIRNETLSPNNAAADATAVVLAYTARIRWPAFVPDNAPTNSRRALPAGYNPAAAVVFDRSKLQSLQLAGSVTR